MQQGFASPGLEVKTFSSAWDAIPDAITSLVLAAWLSGEDVGLWLADFTWPMPDLRLKGDQFVGKLSAMGH